MIIRRTEFIKQLTFFQDLSGASRKVSNQWQSCAVTDWSVDQLCQWLMCLEMDHYKPQFTMEAVDGKGLLALDGNKLKVSENGTGHFGPHPFQHMVPNGSGTKLPLL
jgi:hypothetical protein